MFWVFSNVNTLVGQGLNREITSEEQVRLKMVVARIEHLFHPLGNTLVLAEYPNLAMYTGHFLAQNISSASFDSIVGLRGILEKLRNAEPETLVVSCLSFYKSGQSGNLTFFHQFSTWWNEHYLLIGMPSIHAHEHNGDRSILTIDYEYRRVLWVTNIGEGAETTTPLARILA